MRFIAPCVTVQAQVCVFVASWPVPGNRLRSKSCTKSGNRHSMAQLKPEKELNEKDTD